MSKMVKVVVALVIIILLIALVWHIGIKRHSDIDIIETREAKLYAVTTDNVPILKDNTGELWEMPELEVNAEDFLLLEITNNKITRAWIEININGDEEIPES